MVETCGKQYVRGLVEYINKCDPDRWSKLEVDDVLEKLGVDVSRLDYFYLQPGMNLANGLVRLFDNKSSMEMAEIGVRVGVVDLYAVEANEVLVSQLTQENTHTRHREDGDRGVVGGVGASGTDGGDYGDGDRAMGSVGDEFGDGDRVVGNNEVKDGQADKGNEKGKGQLSAADKGKSKVDAADGVRSGFAENEAAEIPSFIDSEYDLSDQDEDEIMVAQVEGWKKMVDALSKCYC